MSAVKRAIVPALILGAALAAAGPAGATTREFGEFPDQPLPNATCPTNCQAIVQATGYQVEIGSHKHPFKARRDGKIVAFTIRLGKPDPDQLRFFQNTFGGRSQVRLAVLRPARTKNRHRLLAQSEAFNTEPYFGSTPTFALDRALPLLKGNEIALTVPTWVPAFAVGLTQDMSWRSSRPRDDCNEFQIPSAQQTLMSLRTYGCFYRTARLLYTVSYVPTPRATSATRR
jgi:hypothetical protein